MQIKIISLKKDEVRRKRLVDVFSSNSLPYSVVGAVDGRQLPAGEFFRLMVNDDYWFNRRSYLTPGEVGCKLSHLKAMREYLDHGVDGEPLFVFEDDIKFRYSTKNLEFLTSFLAETEESVIIHLGGLDGLANSRRVLMSKHRRVGDLQVCSIFSPTLRWLYRTCGYAMNRQAAEQVSHILEKKNVVADDWRYFKKQCPQLQFLFADLVEHPLDLSSSNINSERET